MQCNKTSIFMNIQTFIYVQLYYGNICKQMQNKNLKYI